jgi:hypothetical protein
MASIVCGDACMKDGKPHVCSSRPGHKLTAHICCCGTTWRDAEKPETAKQASPVKQKPH